jgi:hypothetical protein
MKEFEEVRAKMLEYPPDSVVPLSHREIAVLKANSRHEMFSELTTGYVFGRHFGLEARPGSRFTEGAVIAAAREIRGLRIGDDFRVRCPVVWFGWKKPLVQGDLQFVTETCENFVLTPKMAAQVEARKKSNLDKPEESR